MAKQCAEKNPDDLIGIMEAAVNEARESVARTPNLLPALMEAGRGGCRGRRIIYCYWTALCRFLKGELEDLQFRKPQMVSANITAAKDHRHCFSEEEEAYGYCTNFLLEGDTLDPEKIRT